MFGVWEPLLEPLEVENSDEFRPWVLELKVWFRIIISLEYRTDMLTNIVNDLSL